jgi:hypothetical protein
LQIFSVLKFWLKSKYFSILNGFANLLFLNLNILKSWFFQRKKEKDTATRNSLPGWPNSSVHADVSAVDATAHGRRTYRGALMMWMWLFNGEESTKENNMHKQSVAGLGVDKWATAWDFLTSKANKKHICTSPYIEPKFVWKLCIALL